MQKYIVTVLLIGLIGSWKVNRIGSTLKIAPNDQYWAS